MSLGLKCGTVKVVEYDPKWPKQFEDEKIVLLNKLKGRLLQLEHAGSTAVPGLASKPIIDMVGAIESFNDIDHFIGELGKIGYEYMPEGVAEDRKFFAKGPRENRTHHLSLVLADDTKQWDDKILFRDYLRSNKQAREQYEQLKRNLATTLASDRASYTLAKDDFIAAATKDAKA